MKRLRQARLLLMFALLLAGAMAWVTVGQAQGRGGAAQPAPAPVRLRIQVTQVKPEMVGTYQDLIRNQLIPALKKAGEPWRWTYTSGPIGQGFTFVSAQPVTNYAQFDKGNPLQRAMGAEWVTGYNAKLRPTLVSTGAWVQTFNPNMSIMSNAPTPPALVVVQDFDVIPGKNGEFTTIMTTDYLPAFKKAGVKDFWVYATNFGAPGGRISTVRAIANYAELDPQPGGGLLVQGGVSQETAQQINARRAALISGTETNIYQYVPDLSYGMPAAPPSTR